MVSRSFQRTKQNQSIGPEELVRSALSMFPIRNVEECVMMGKSALSVLSTIATSVSGLMHPVGGGTGRSIRDDAHTFRCLVTLRNAKRVHRKKFKRGKPLDNEKCHPRNERLPWRRTAV